MSFTYSQMIEIAALVVASGIITSVSTWFFNKKKSSAEVKKISQETEHGQVESASLILEMAQNLIKDISSERESLREENNNLDATLSKLRGEIASLKEQVVQLTEQVRILNQENADLRKMIDSQNQNNA